jgi:hypothetical protein
MAVTEDVYVKLKLDSTDFEKSMEKSTHDVNEFAREVKGSSTLVDNWGGAIGAATALIGGATTAIAILTAEVAKGVVETEKYAERLGIATKELLALQGVARSFGVDTEEINEGLKNMKERLGEAFLEGRGATFDAINKLGLDLERLKTLDTKNQFLEIADALSKVEDEGERTFLQMEIGQEEFFKLGNIIGKGREEIEAMILAQKALGAGLDVKKLKEFGDAQNRLSNSFKNSADNVATFWAPALGLASEKTADLLDWFNKLGTHLDKDPYKDQVESIKKLEEALISIQKIDPFIAQQKEAETLILDRIAGEKTIAQIAFESDSRHGAKEKEASDLRGDIQKRLEEEAKTKNDAQDSLFKTWEEEDKRAAQQKQLNSASGAYQTSGVLERGSVSEASIGAGKANQYEIKSANTLDKMLQLMKKENRSSQLIKVNQL